MRRKFILWTGGILLIGSASLFYFLIYPVFLQPIIPPDREPISLYIPTHALYPQVVDSLLASGLDIPSKPFNQCAKLLKYPDLVKPGHYRLTPRMTAWKLIRHLRSGQQAPVNVTFNNLRNIEALAGKVSRYLEPDSLAFLECFARLRDYLPDSPVGEDSTLCLFIPNSYEFMWNTSPLQFVERMMREYTIFWSDERAEAAKALGLTPVQVYILASIVEKETIVHQEKPTIAGVYLNRLQRGMLLQADPTVVFAIGDFQRERILLRDLEVESPYNTYKYAGLPPGPIYMPDTRSIEAVLHPELHDYLYFCARADDSGRHAFAKTLAAHNENARKFQAWLNQQRIFQ